LHQLLERTAERLPEKDAVVHGEEKHSFALINDQANRMANALLQAGIEKGDRVGILMQNSTDFLSGYFGALKMGGVVVPLNTAVTPDAFPYILGDAGIRALVFDGSVKPLRDRLNREAGGLAALFHGERAAGLVEPEGPECPVIRPLREVFETESGGIPGQEISSEDLACLMYTSGSTGKPKGVALSHENIVENTRSILGYLELTPEDRGMVVLPFFYCYGASLVHTHFAVGGTLVLENQFLYPNKVLEKMDRERVTGFAGVPSTFAILLRRSNLHAHDFEHLRYVTQAGGAMAPALIRELQRALPRTKIFIMYGQTEASARLSYLPPDRLEAKLGSIGKAIPNVELRVLNRKGEEVKVGEVGEIVARGANIMKGYWNSPEETRNVLDGDGLHTGDLARVDEDGFLYIVGREKDMIKSGSHRVSAKEIEDLLLEEPSVLECAVIGVEDEMMGEVIKAFVVPVNRKQVQEDDLVRFCKKRLPPYKVPRVVEITRALPKNEAGKIMKGLLKEPPAEEKSASL